MKKKVLRNAAYVTIIGSLISNNVAGATVLAAEEITKEGTTSEPQAELSTDLLPTVASDEIQSTLQEEETEQSTTAEVSDEVIATGVDGTAPWTMYKDGRFVMEAGELSEGERDWTAYSDIVKSIDFAGKVVFPKDSNSIFTGMFNVESINFKNIDTSKVTNMSDMFHRMTKIKTLDLSSFDTSNVTDMSGMFYGLENLSELNISSFDTSNVEKFKYFKF